MNKQRPDVPEELTAERAAAIQTEVQQLGNRLWEISREYDTSKPDWSNRYWQVPPSPLAKTIREVSTQVSQLANALHRVWSELDAIEYGDTGVYTGDFSDYRDVFSNFGVSEEGRAGVKIIYADYDTPPYEGYAWAIFEKDGKLYETSGSHCSCYGLEDQWDPELASPKEVLNRLRAHTFEGKDEVLERVGLFLGLQ